jgi:secondary thiamine-phosphate synthase enzyme
MIKTARLTVQTRGNTDIIDITADIAKNLEQSNLDSGVVTVFVTHSTAAITAIENEPGLIKDFKKLFERLAPSDIEYSHDSGLEEGNGYAHVRASLVGPSLSVPFAGRRLSLGTWQHIVLVDFDNRTRTRQVSLQFMGE